MYLISIFHLVSVIVHTASTDQHFCMPAAAGAASDGRPALGAEGQPSQVALSKSQAVFSARGKLLVVSAAAADSTDHSMLLDRWQLLLPSCHQQISSPSMETMLYAVFSACAKVQMVSLASHHRTGTGYHKLCCCMLFSLSAFSVQTGPAHGKLVKSRAVQRSTQPQCAV
jgi:hypothetical protein